MWPHSQAIGERTLASSGSAAAYGTGVGEQTRTVHDESRAMDPLAPQVLVRPFKTLRKPSDCVGTAWSWERPNAGTAHGKGP